MVDYKTDSRGNIIFDSGDIKEVSGMEEFEQRVMRAVYVANERLIGDSRKEANHIKHLKLAAERAVRQSPVIDRLVGFSARRIDQRTYQVTVDYHSDLSRSVQFEIEG